jgi:tellurite resistance protein
MTPEIDDHPALGLDEVRRGAYLEAVAMLVLADGLVDPKELRSLSALCRSLEVSDATERRVLQAAQQGVPDAREGWLETIRNDRELSLALLIDAVVMAMADGKVASAEAEEIASLGAKLGISTAKATHIGAYVAGVVRHGASDPEANRLSRELADGLAAVGRHGPTSPHRISRFFRACRGQA